MANWKNKLHDESKHQYLPFLFNGPYCIARFSTATDLTQIGALIFNTFFGTGVNSHHPQILIFLHALKSNETQLQHLQSK